MKKSTLFCLAICLPATSQASALYFYEMATEDTALAGAGQAVRVLAISWVLFPMAAPFTRRN